MIGKRIAIVAIVAILSVVVALAFLLSRSPFRRDALVKALEEKSSSAVEIAKFREIYLPHPGCVAEGLTFRRTNDSPAPGAPPLIAIQRLTIEGSYMNMLALEQRVSRLRVEGLNVHLPPRHDGHRSNVAAQSDATSKPSKLVIAEIVADGAIVETFPRNEKPPLRFEARKLTIGNIGTGRQATFRITLENAKPPGEVRATGRIGPWVSKNTGQTPVSGEYIFERGNLGIFHGIGGFLSSQGKFMGPLQHIGVSGTVETPDFSVTRSHHAVHLTSTLQAVVNGTNGDVTLENVDAHLQRSELISHGTIAGRPGEKGKTALIEMTMRQGRIQDLLYLFVKAEPPPMTGMISLRATATLPPEKRKFIEKLLLQGDFGIGGARFTKKTTQTAIDKISGRARGEKDDADLERVISNLKGHVSLRNGIATLSNISFSVPGALANMQGTFNLLNEKVALSGTLRMDAKLSEATKGVKSFLLKAVDPFFKKKGAGAVVPVKITGTYSHAVVGLNFGGKKKKK